MRGQSASVIRTSIGSPREVYTTLEGIETGEKVALAWVVREAAEEYIAKRWPLFKAQE